jgi:hypothetical protein
MIWWEMIWRKPLRQGEGYLRDASWQLKGDPSEWELEYEESLNLLGRFCEMGASWKRLEERVRSVMVRRREDIRVPYYTFHREWRTDQALLDVWLQYTIAI